MPVGGGERCGERCCKEEVKECGEGEGDGYGEGRWVKVTETVMSAVKPRVRVRVKFTVIRLRLAQGWGRVSVRDDQGGGAKVKASMRVGKVRITYITPSPLRWVQPR